MTISEAIYNLKSLINMNFCPNLFNNCINWLEELQLYKGEKLECEENMILAYEQGRADAIKEIEKIAYIDCDCDGRLYLYEDDLNKLKEQK